MDADALDRLEALAREATPGPWAALETALVSDSPDVGDDGDQYDFGSATVVDYAPYGEQAGSIPHAPNADYIAAFSPDVTLDLISLARDGARWRAERERVAQRNDWLGDRG